MAEERTYCNPREIKRQAWDNFTSSFDYESDDQNFKYNFKTMTKKYGQAFIEYYRAAYCANETLSDKEFCNINANMPKSFFENVIK